MIDLEQDVRAESTPAHRPGPPARWRPTWVWGLPFAPLTAAAAIDEVERLIDAGEPAYFITANLNYMMLSHADPAVREVNRGAAMILADGMPPVLASRRSARPLPERVAGSDLIFALCDLAARRGFGVFLLGGAPGVAERAARNLEARAPGLRVVGTEAPPAAALADPAEEAALLARIRAARPDLLLVAFGQPKGELWLARNLRALDVAVGVQVGAALDFAAGRVRRAPRWVRDSGLEWAFRLALEPGRLARRYARNALYLARMLARSASGGDHG